MVATKSHIGNAHRTLPKNGQQRIKWSRIDLGAVYLG